MGFCWPYQLKLKGVLIHMFEHDKRSSFKFSRAETCRMQIQYLLEIKAINFQMHAVE